MVNGQNIADLTDFDRSETGVEQAPKLGIWRTLRALVLLALVSVLLGFGWFLYDINSYPRSLDADLKAGGIVVLTGGFARLEPAVELLRQEHAERLLVSGVNRNNSDGSLKNALNISDGLYDCCVDLDQDALDTIGNAYGTAHWVNAKNYSSIIVVTNDYHMPRSILEMKRVLPEIELHPFAVRNAASADETISRKLHRYRVLIGEYGKYAAARLRGLFAKNNAVDLSRASLSAGW